MSFLVPPHSALVLVDIQYDFLPGGSLAITDADKILPVVYDVLDTRSAEFDLIAVSLVPSTQVSIRHARGHVSFASTHSKPPFTSVDIRKPGSSDTITQMLWPDHCIQSTKGSDLEAGLAERLAKLGDKVTYIHKGTSLDVDAYSAFEGHDIRTGSSDLASIFRHKGISHAIVLGLATDYCVKATAADSVKNGFNTTLVKAGLRGVTPESSAAALELLRELGCELV